MNCDVLVVGAGFAGMTMAQKLSNELGLHCIVVDKRSHIGGNAYDYYDEMGVLVHKYGPHLFHTNSLPVYKYLSNFTMWRPAKYTASSYTQGRMWSFPVNLKTYEQLIGRASSQAEMEAYLEENRIPIEHPANSEEAIISQVGVRLYEMFYKGYTLKQWGRHPRDLDASVCMRIPIRTNRNDVYFNDAYQCMPSEGYTKLFERMLNPKLQLLLNTDIGNPNVEIGHKHLVYTGPVDEYFNYVFGPLKYRTVRFEHHRYGPDELDSNGFVQPTTSVAYPDESVAFTRSIEIKHATRQVCLNSTVIREFPKEFEKGDTPYYPIPDAESAAAYAKYKELADKEVNTTFVGRLATYKYYNMDQVVAAALHKFEIVKEKLCQA
jgi:UDP-galactopyranose mutase